MNKIPRQKTCLGLTVVVSLLGLIGIVIVVGVAIVGVVFFVQLLDEVTSSIDDQPTGEAFFKSTGGWDYKRIPLIEPYQAINTNDSWFIDLQTDTIRYQNLAGATKLDVIDKQYIVTYGADKLFSGTQADEVWFVIIPAENIEVGFTNEENFLTYLKDRGIDEFNLRDIDGLYEELGNKGYLDWFPEVYKE